MTLLFDEVLKDVEETGSKYRDICRCRDDLLGFLDRNEWFGQTPVNSGKDIAVEDYECMRESIRLWLSAYQKSPRERMMILADRYRDTLPDTCNRYLKFAENEGIADKPSGWKILDFILSSCVRELCTYNREELDQLMEATSECLPVSSVRIFARFVTENRINDGVRYEIHSRRQAELEKDAYSIRDFSRMAFYVFNERSWKENQLVEKAFRSKRQSNLWLFVALHFFGAIRQSDFIRFPSPALPYSKEKVKAMIKAGTYTDRCARTVAEEFLLLLKYQPMVPSKTERYQGIPELKFYVPESLRTAMGWIISLRLIHKKDDEAMVEPVQDIITAKKFFGEGFTDVIGRRRFQTRRANKSYLQGIELVTEDIPGRPKGYMLAALARSHKGGIDSLPDITDIYLRDAAFSGYRPEFILHEMFERGIFGFIPAMLLERYAGKEYQGLDVSSQTELIKRIGLDAIQIESLTCKVEESLVSAKRIVEQLPEDSLGSILQNVACGEAVSRQKELFCIRTAAGQNCTEPLRSSCFGCGYEIYTKAAFHLLMKEYRRISLRKNEEDGTEKDRLRNILVKGILPSVREMLESIPILYPDADMGIMVEMLERGMRDADSGRITGA